MVDVTVSKCFFEKNNFIYNFSNIKIKKQIYSKVIIKKMKKKKILIVAAHPDDEILGCGGSIIKLKNNHEIKVIFLTNGVSGRIKNKQKLLKKKRMPKII